MTPAPPHLVVEWGGALLDGVDQSFVTRVLETALRATNDPRLAGRATWLLSLSVVDDEEMAALNAHYRGIPATTDVLSFPQLEAPARAGASPLWPPEGEGSAVPLVLGDIVVSLPRTLAQAQEYGHSMQRELGFLLVHGVLHLLGHDHESDDERRVMRAEEERILTLLALTRPDEGTEHA